MARIRFPNEVYRLIPALYPHFAEILQDVKLSGTEFFALSYVKNQGKDIGNGEVALPLATLRKMLQMTGAYDSPSGALGFISTHLQNKKEYLRHHRLTPEQKTKLFPKSPGYRDAVIVTEEGLKKLHEVNKRVEQLFEQAVKNISPIVLKPTLKAFQSIASHLIERLDELLAARGNTETR